MITLYSHFIELRYRLFYLLFSFCITFLVSYNNSFDLFFLILQPFVVSNNFIFINVAEAFSTTISISILISIHFILPFFIYHSWSFFIPGCFFHERQKIKKIIHFLFILLVIETIVILLVIIPEIFSFLSSFEIKTNLLTIELEPRIQSFVLFIFKLYFVILLVFQIPLIFFLLFRYELLKNKKVSVYRKYFYFLFILLAAFFSPPDALYQLILAFLLTFLFEVGIWLSFIYEKIGIIKKR